MKITDLPSEVVEFEIIPRVGTIHNYTIYNTSKQTREALSSRIKSDTRKFSHKLALEGNLLSILIKEVNSYQVLLRGAALGNHRDVLDFAFAMGAVVDQIAISNACEGGFFGLADSFILRLNRDQRWTRVGMTVISSLIEKATRAGCRGGHRETIQWAKDKFLLLSKVRPIPFRKVEKNGFIGACEGGDIDLFEVLTKEYDLKTMSTGFYLALRRGNREVVEWFYRTYPPGDYLDIYRFITSFSSPFNDSTLLEEVIEKIEGFGVSMMNLRNLDGIIKSAASGGNISLLQKILARGFKLSTTQVRMILTSGHEDITMLVMSKLKKKDVAGPENSIGSLRYYLPVFISKNEELIIAIFRRLICIKDSFTKKDLNSFLFKAAFNRMRSLVEFLITLDIDINRVLKGGCAAKDHSLIAFALSHGANNYKEAFFMACRVGDLSIMKQMSFQLKKEGLESTKVYRTALVTAARAGKKSCVEYILSHVDVERKGEKRALFGAASAGHGAIIDFIMEKSSINRADLINISFSGASSGGHVYIAKKMLSLGASCIDVAFNHALLSRSSPSKKKSMVEFLLTQGVEDLNKHLIAYCLGNSTHYRGIASLDLIKVLLGHGADDLDGAFSSVCKNLAGFSPFQPSSCRFVCKVNVKRIYQTLRDCGARNCTHCEKSLPDHEGLKCNGNCHKI